MITIDVSNQKVVEIKIDLDLSTPRPVLIFERKEEYGYMAQLVKIRIKNLLAKKIESIRREAYNQGWRDAKSKTISKEIWFSSQL